MTLILLKNRAANIKLERFIGVAYIRPSDNIQTSAHNIGSLNNNKSVEDLSLTQPLKELKKKKENSCCFLKIALLIPPKSFK